MPPHLGPEWSSCSPPASSQQRFCGHSPPRSLPTRSPRPSAGPAGGCSSTARRPTHSAATAPNRSGRAGSSKTGRSCARRRARATSSRKRRSASSSCSWNIGSRRGPTAASCSTCRRTSRLPGCPGRRCRSTTTWRATIRRRRAGSTPSTSPLRRRRSPTRRHGPTRSRPMPSHAQCPRSMRPAPPASGTISICGSCPARAKSASTGSATISSRKGRRTGTPASPRASSRSSPRSESPTAGISAFRITAISSPSARSRCVSSPQVAPPSSPRTARQQ